MTNADTQVVDGFGEMPLNSNHNRMKRYLCSHWALHPNDAAWVRSMNFTGLRFDIPFGAPGDYIAQMFDTVHRLKLDALAIVCGWCYWHDTKGEVHERGWTPPSAAINLECKRVAGIWQSSKKPPTSWEIGNEPDLSRWRSPEHFADRAEAGFLGINSKIPGANIILGGVSNIDKKGGARYLERVRIAGTSCPITGIHPYRTAYEPWETPKGWASLAEAREWVRSLGRVWITEGGWHTAPQKKWGKIKICGKKVQWSNASVAKFAVEEMKIWQGIAECYSYYQINDGHDPDNSEHNFGLRFLDGKPKPVAYAFQEIV